jgi:hypothetical protein
MIADPLLSKVVFFLKGDTEVPISYCSLLFYYTGLFYYCYSFFFFLDPPFLSFNSSASGTTLTISSGSKLSSEGAFSEPAELVVSPSIMRSCVYLNTYNKAFLICLLVISI